MKPKLTPHELQLLADEDLMTAVDNGDPDAFAALRPPRRRGVLARPPDRRRPSSPRTSPRRRSSRLAERRAIRFDPRQRPLVDARDRPQPRDRRPAPDRQTAPQARLRRRLGARGRAGRGAHRHRGIRRETARSVRGALGDLPSEQSEVIGLAYFGGFTHTEIAEMLGMPLGTVKGRMRLGLEKNSTRAGRGDGY